MKPFWNATGFSPAGLLLNPDMQQVVKEIGEMPSTYFDDLTKLRKKNLQLPIDLPSSFVSLVLLEQ
jgi:hypothetical protein